LIGFFDVGYGEDYNKSEIFGDLQEMRFCVIYRRDSRIIALCTANCDPIAAKMAFDMEDGVEWDTGYPDYILEAFPNPPMTGSDMFE
jgi:hypothetical protein